MNYIKYMKSYILHIVKFDDFAFGWYINDVIENKKTLIDSYKNISINDLDFIEKILYFSFLFSYYKEYKDEKNKYLVDKKWEEKFINYEKIMLQLIENYSDFFKNNRNKIIEKLENENIFSDILKKYDDFAWKYNIIFLTNTFLKNNSLFDNNILLNVLNIVSVTKTIVMSPLIDEIIDNLLSEAENNNYQSLLIKCIENKFIWKEIFMKRLVIPYWAFTTPWGCKNGIARINFIKNIKKILNIKTTLLNNRCLLEHSNYIKIEAKKWLDYFNKNKDMNILINNFECKNSIEEIAND